jgi:aryl-alcohol dehydrogenase-like predicted oxidoreductase
VVGPTRPEHLQPVVEALSHPLGAEEREQLSQVFAR